MAGPIVKITPSLGISKMKLSEFDAFVFDKIEKVTGNPDFLITKPLIADVRATYDLFHPLQAAGRNLNNLQRTTRDGLYDTLYGDMTNLAWNVANLSDGDLVKYASTGFKKRKPGDPYNDLLPSPTGNEVNTKKGEGRVEVSSDKLPYSKNFITRYGIAGTDVAIWKQEVGERVQMLSDLTPGDKMELQRAGNGKKGTGFYCTKIAFTVPFD